MSPESQTPPELPGPEELARDGIVEEDHPIPLWFNVGFYGLLVVGVIYILYFSLSGWSQADRYVAEVARAEERFAAARAELPAENPFRGDAAAIAEGRETYLMVCAACHQADGTGLVGPSLVDDEWSYGGSDAELFASVAEGRPQGMPPWAAQLGTERIWKVLAFMETLAQENGPGGAAAGAGAGGP